MSNDNFDLKESNQFFREEYYLKFTKQLRDSDDEIILNKAKKENKNRYLTMNKILKYFTPLQNFTFHSSCLLFCV